MKLTLHVFFSLCLMVSARGQENHFFNQEAMASYEGLENVREYLLNRNKRILRELHHHYQEKQKTNQTRDGVEIDDSSVDVLGAKAPDLFHVGSLFISTVNFLHDEIMLSDTKLRLLHRGFSPKDLNLLIKITSGKNTSTAYIRSRMAKVNERINLEFNHLTPCSSLAYDILVLDYTVKMMSQLSMPSRRAMLAYIFEFRVRTPGRAYDRLCFTLDPDVLFEGLEQLTTENDYSEREEP